jgi:hypothetical protein
MGMCGAEVGEDERRAPEGPFIPHFCSICSIFFKVFSVNYAALTLQIYFMYFMLPYAISV